MYSVTDKAAVIEKNICLFLYCRCYYYHHFYFLLLFFLQNCFLKKYYEMKWVYLTRIYRFSLLVWGLANTFAM